MQETELQWEASFLRTQLSGAGREPIWRSFLARESRLGENRLLRIETTHPF